MHCFVPCGAAPPGAFIAPQPNPMPFGPQAPSPMNGSVALPQPTVQSLSYVPPVGFSPVALPDLPPKLTEGVPDPSEIARQKDGYAKGIDLQFRQGAELLNAQHKQTTEWLHGQADQQKQQALLAIDQQVKQEELQLSQKYNEQLMFLHQAAQRQRSELEQQANSLALEYQTKRSQEEYMEEQYNIQKKSFEQQVQLMEDLEGNGTPVVAQGFLGAGASMWPAPLPPSSLGVAPGMMMGPPTLQNGSLSVAPGIMAPPSMGMAPPPNNFSMGIPMPSPTGVMPGAMQPYGAPPAPLAPYQPPPTNAYPGMSVGSWVAQTNAQQRSYVPPVGSYVPPVGAQPILGQTQTLPTTMNAYTSAPLQHNQLSTQQVAGGPYANPMPTSYHPDPSVHYAETSAHYLSHAAFGTITEASVRCICGNIFMADAVYCRKCGRKRP